MIPAPFDYHRPSDVAAAVQLLTTHGDEARVIAGGHSLVPMMKLRMTDIQHLVDLQDIAELNGISVDGGRVTIGAMTSQHDLIASDQLGSAAPLVREAALQIADPQVRYMGTLGGNIANGDPGNDMPGLMQCLDAAFTLVGPNGSRTVAAREFYEAAYFTAREDDELLTAVSFESHASGYAYVKQKRKIGDYATAAAAVLLSVDGGVCQTASVAMTNLSDTPVHSAAAGEALAGSTLDSVAVDAAVAAMVADIDPSEDNKGPVEFKNHVAGVVLRRAIETAASRA